jgi:hypothetical protein
MLRFYEKHNLASVTITEARLFETEVRLFGWLNCKLFGLACYEKPLSFLIQICAIKASVVS